MLLPCSDCHRVGFLWIVDHRITVAPTHETWSKLSCKVCFTCISFPDVWSVVSSANMSEATDIFVTCNGRSLVEILNRIGPRTDPCSTINLQSLRKNMSHGATHVAFCLQNMI